MTTRVFVHTNEPDAIGEVLLINRRDTMAQFFRDAKKKLRIRGKRAFLDSGVEIKRVDELQNNDYVYISQGEGFHKKKITSYAPSDSGQDTVSISVVGAGGVGKSALTLRFVRDFFMDYWDATIEDAYRKAVEVDGKLCVLEILDTAGQDDFHQMRSQWMMDKDGHVFVCSLDSPQSLLELKKFRALQEQIHTDKIEADWPPIIVVANKKDIMEEGDPAEYQLASRQCRHLAKEYGAYYIETSALTGEGVTDAFEAIIRKIRKSKNVPRPPVALPWTSWCNVL